MEKASEITPALIEKLVHTFYGRIQKDSLLGPIFAREIRDWDEHLPKMVAFWSSITLKTRSYSGRPVPAHANLQGLTTAHFDHWLELFEKTAGDIFTGEPALEFIRRAHQIANSLKMAIDTQRGLLPGMDGALCA